MNRRWSYLWAWVLLGLGACQTFQPPTAGLDPLIEPDIREGRRTKAQVRITSDWFNGEFQAIKIERAAPDAGVRFQLFPELGGKLLDVVARPDSVIAHWPHTGEVQRTREALIGFLSVSLMENATQLQAERVKGVREVDGGTLLDVIPASLGLDLQVHVLIDRKGAPVARHYVLDGIGWTEELRPSRRIHSRNFEWLIQEESSEDLARPKDRIFELAVPEDERP